MGDFLGKRLNRRTLLGGIVGSAGAAILAACGSSNATSTAAPAAPTTGAGAATATKAPAAAASATTGSAATTASGALPPAAGASPTAGSTAAATTGTTSGAAPAATTTSSSAVAGGSGTAVSANVPAGTGKFAAKFASSVGAGSDVDKVDLTGKKIDLTFYHTQTKGNEDALKKIAADFTAANPGITVTPQYIGTYSDVSAKINVGIQAKQVPELAVGYENDVANYMTGDAVLDLTPYINSTKYGWKKEDLSDIFGGFLDRNVYTDFKNQILSAPFTSSVFMMWYNEDMLKMLGFNGPAKTWDEFKAQAAAAQKAGKKGFPFNPDTSNVDSMVFSYGGDVITDDNKKAKFDTPQSLAALQVIEDMTKAGTMFQFNAKNNEDQTMFINGEVPFFMGSSTGRGYVQPLILKDPKDPNSGDKFVWNGAVIPQSTENAASPKTALYGGNAIVFKSTPEKQLASWQFIKYFTSRDVTAYWAQQTGYLPVRKSAAESADYKKFLDQKSVNSAPIRVAPAGKGEPQPAGWSKARTDITDITTQVLNKQLTAKDATAQIQKKVNDDLTNG